MAGFEVITEGGSSSLSHPALRSVYPDDSVLVASDVQERLAEAMSSGMRAGVVRNVRILLEAATRSAWGPVTLVG